MLWTVLCFISLLFLFNPVSLILSIYFFSNINSSHLFNISEALFPTCFFPLDYTSSLYLLSALAQSQAALFAIAFGLNSIILQMVSTIYSSRFSYLVKTISGSLWLTCGLSIFYDLGLILLLPTSLGIFSCSFVVISLIVATCLYASLFRQVKWNINLLSLPNVLCLIRANNFTELRVLIFDIMFGFVEKRDIISFKQCLAYLLAF
jgi:hypothetical protein